MDHVLGLLGVLILDDHYEISPIIHMLYSIDLDFVNGDLGVVESMLDAFGVALDLGRDSGRRMNVFLPRNYDPDSGFPDAFDG